MKKYLEELTHLRRIDGVMDIYSDKSLPINHKVFTRIAIKYIDNVKYYMCCLSLYSLKKDYINHSYKSVYIGDALFSTCRSLKSFDLTVDEWNSLVFAGKTQDDRIDDSNYPIIVDGYYDDADIVILSKISFYGDYIIMFADTTGELYSICIDDFYTFMARNKHDKSYNVYFSNFTDNNKLSFKQKKINNHGIEMGEPYFLGYIWYKGNLRLNINTNYKNLEAATKLIKLFDYNLSDIDYIEYVQTIGEAIYGNVWSTKKIPRYHLRLDLILSSLNNLRYAENYPFGNFTQENVLITYENIPLNIRIYNLYDELSNTKLKTGNIRLLDTIKITDSQLEFRGCLLGVFNLPCVYATFVYSIINNSFTFYDVKVYEYTDDNYIPGNSFFETYGRSFFILTGNNQYIGNETLDFSVSFIPKNQIQKQEKLDACSLSEKLKSLGYYKKTRMLIPDYTFFETGKSVWLNKTDFVNIRSYKREKTEEFLLDIYRNGQLLESISGNFTPDSIRSAMKLDTDNKFNYLVPKIYAEMFRQCPFNVFYTEEFFFKDFKSKYNYGIKYAQYHLRVLKYYPSNIYVIALELNDVNILDKLSRYESLLNDGYYETKNGIDRHYSHDIYYILMAFKNEDEAFLAFDKLIESYSSSINTNDINDFGNWLSLLLFKSLRVNITKTNYRNNVISCILSKHFGLIDDSWKDILSNIPDDVFNTMILE